MRIAINGIARDTESLNQMGDITAFFLVQGHICSDCKGGGEDRLIIRGFASSRAWNAADPDFIHKPSVGEMSLSQKAVPKSSKSLY